MRWFPSRHAAGTVPALFLHIQKTAGTSLVTMARRYYGDSVVSHADYCDFAPDALRNYGFVSGHFGYAYARSLMENRYSFTFLRDPAERILSFYYFCRAREHIQYDIYQLARDHDLPAFLEICMADPFLKMQVWNNQVWQLAHGYVPPHTDNIDEFSPAELLNLAKEHLHEFSHVGFTETFQDDARIICKALKFMRPQPHEQPVMENVTPLRPRLSVQPAATREMLMRMTELDRELYDYARTMREAPRSGIGRWWRR
jgi:hypothetical protein